MCVVSPGVRTTLRPAFGFIENLSREKQILRRKECEKSIPAPAIHCFALIDGHIKYSNDTHQTTFQAVRVQLIFIYLIPRESVAHHCSPILHSSFSKVVFSKYHNARKLWYLFPMALSRAKTAVCEPRSSAPPARPEMHRRLESDGTLRPTRRRAHRRILSFPQARDSRTLSPIICYLSSFRGS